MRMGPKRRARAASPRPNMTTRGFGNSLAAFAKKTEVTMDEAYRGIVIELFSSVIADTPVDEGRARGNWQVGIGSPPSGITMRLDDTGPVGSPQAKRTGGAVTAVLSARYDIHETSWLANNLPYVHRLEYDHWSGQAPHGMVRKNMARVERIVNEVASGVRKA